MKIMIALSLFLTCMTLTISQTPADAAGSSESISVTDFRGKSLAFRKPIARIVCLIESALSGIYMLGQEQRVVGISRNVYQGDVFRYYAAMDSRIRNKQLPAPGNWDFVNIESVIALKPDLVIIWANQTESIAAMEERGLSVYGVFLSSKEDVYKEMSDFGMLTGSHSRAQDLINYTKMELLRIQHKTRVIPKQKKQRVYYMWAQGNLETSCGRSTVNDLLELAGSRNVCADTKDEHAVVNMEKVLGWDPDMIVMWGNARKDPDDIIRDPQLQSIKAVKSKKVFELPEVFLCDLWTLKFHYAVKLVSRWAYPELYKDVNPEKEKSDMLHRLYGARIKGI